MTEIQKAMMEFVKGFEAKGGKFILDERGLWVTIHGRQTAHSDDWLKRLDVKRRDALVAYLSREADRPAELTMKDWDALLHAWTQARCAWRERSFGSTSALYISACVWCAANDKPMPVTLQAFEETLRHLGFDVADSFVYGLILDDDAQASDTRPPRNDFERLVSPEAVALDNLYTLPARKPGTTERKRYAAR